METKKQLQVIITVILMVAVFFIIYTNRGNTLTIKELSNLKNKLELDITKYQNSLDSVNLVIEDYKDSIDVLIIEKHKIKFNYDAKLKSFRDVNVVSDDSITRYISDKIYNR